MGSVCHSLGCAAILLCRPPPMPPSSMASPGVTTLTWGSCVVWMLRGGVSSCKRPPTPFNPKADVPAPKVEIPAPCRGARRLSRQDAIAARRPPGCHGY